MNLQMLRLRLQAFYQNSEQVVENEMGTALGNPKNQ